MTSRVTNLLEHYFIAESASSEDAPVIELSPDGIAEALGARVPSDAAFDLHMPPDIRAVSGTYWTPLLVAVRAIEWLEPLGVTSLVDIGSGAGKFCVAAALAGRIAITGIEHRPRLVLAARALARTFGVEDRVSFVEDEIGEGPVPSADAYYLYNPFGENLYRCGEQLDDDVELSDDRFARDVSATRELFRSAPLGTYVLTYNGFGGRLPMNYHEVRVDRTLPNMLRLWRKTGVERTRLSPLDGD